MGLISKHNIIFPCCLTLYHYQGIGVSGSKPGGEWNVRDALGRWWKGIYGMVWYGMVWYGMVWYDMVWYGMVWYGMIWYGKVWYDMVWIHNNTSEGEVARA